MFEQQKLKSDHKDQIGKTRQRAKDLLDNAKLLVEDLKMKVDKEAGKKKTAALAAMSPEASNDALAASQPEKDPEKVRQKLEKDAVKPYMEYIRQIAGTSEPQSLATPALKPAEDFIVRTVFSKSEKVLKEEKEKGEANGTCSTQAFPNNLQQTFDTSDKEKACGLDWKEKCRLFYWQECRLFYWQERLKEAKAKLKILIVVKMIAVHQVN